MKEKYNIVKKKFSLKRINNAIIYLSILSVFSFLLFQAERLEFIEFSEGAVNIIRNLLITFFSFLIASLFIRFTIKYFLNSFNKIETEQKLLLSKFYSFIVYLIAVFVVLANIGVTIQNLTLIIGIAATGLAFTIREVLINYFAWFMFLTKKPFRIGDHVEIENVEGKIVHIGTFYVFVEQDPQSKDILRVPNKKFLDNPINNLGKAPFTFNLTYNLKEIDIKKLETFENKLIKEIDNELKVELISDQGNIKININGKVNDFVERNKLRTKIIKKLVEIFPLKN